jgi:FixJ family two-component response regulator
MGRVAETLRSSDVSRARALAVRGSRPPQQKQTAAELGNSEITIQVHRGQIMRKIAASSLADLVKMAGKLRIS